MTQDWVTAKLCCHSGTSASEVIESRHQRQYYLYVIASDSEAISTLTFICPQPRSEAPNATNETFLVILERSEESRKVSEYSGTSASEVIESQRKSPYFRLWDCFVTSFLAMT